jgi:hypothetical protein
MATTRKRWRKGRPKPAWLQAYYGKDEDGEGPDVCVMWGAGCSKCDAHLLHSALANERCTPDVTKFNGPNGGMFFDAFKYMPSFLDELEARGYDLTLKFAVRKKERPDVPPA